MRATIAALQYAALQIAWPAARAAHHFSEQDEADWAAGMDALWHQMTPAEQQAVEDGLKLVSTIDARALHVTPAQRWEGYQPPRLPEADRIDAALSLLTRMTPDQVFEMSVRAGIHHPDGTLTKEYCADQEAANREKP